MEKRHLGITLGIVILVIILGGCSALNSTPEKVSNKVEETASGTNNEAAKTEEVATEEEDSEAIFKEDLVKFFNQFYKVTESDILALNPYPTEYDESYEGYDVTITEFEETSNKILKDYISTELNGKLENKKAKYFSTDVHFPRFVEVNGHVIIDYKGVSDVSFVILEETEDKITASIDVLLKAETISEEMFNSMYQFNDDKKYYVKTDEKSTIQDADKDEIKVQCSYFGEFEKKKDEKNNEGIEKKEDVENKDNTKDKQDVENKQAEDKKEDQDSPKFTLISLKEKGEVAVPEQTRRKIINNDFVKRVNYLDKPIPADEKLVRDFFVKFMNHDKDAYQYYQNGYDMGKVYFETVLEDLDIDNFLLLDEEDYKSQFPKSIIPTKDDIISVSVSDLDVNIKVHVDTSKKVRTYIVDCSAEVRLSDYSSSNMTYRYYVTVKEDEEDKPKITRIQYISVQPVEIKEEVQGETEQNGNPADSSPNESAEQPKEESNQPTE